MKKLFPLSLLLLMTVLTSCQTSFEGNEKIIISDNKISNLEELINLPEFKDKILYINLYSFYCKHSVNEFPYIKRLQQTVQQTSEANKDVVFIYLSTPKWAFENNWRSNIEDYDLAGYHFLMNEEFEDEFWSHFPEEQRATPFFVEVTEDNKILKTVSPSTMFLRSSLNSLELQTFRFVKANLDSVLSEHPENFDLLFKLDGSSEQKISFFAYSKNNPDNLQEVDVWKDLKIFVNRSFDSIPAKEGLSGYSFAVPLDAETLDSIIPE